MAAKGIMNTVASAPMLCQRCSIAEATLQIRSDHVCQKCFIQYVNTKAVKRMETYRARGPASKVAKKLLLPISFGPSSTCLLHILDHHLKTQLDRMGRTSYELIVVYLDLQPEYPSSDRLELFKTRFPKHTYIKTDIYAALDLDTIEWKTLGVDKPASPGTEGFGKERIAHLVDSLPSATSRADVIATLMSRLLVDFANKNECESILFGDSTTRLAEKTLTETAKGRGFSLPWQVSDGISPFGVNFYYPMRDLLKKEVVQFSSLITPPLNELIVYQSASSQISASSKSTTIDDLMAQYFESVEENYPSVVANVVRTSSKLAAPPSDTGSKACNLCGLPVSKGTDGIHGWGGDQNFGSREVNTDQQGSAMLCYGCSRSING